MKIAQYLTHQILFFRRIHQAKGSDLRILMTPKQVTALAREEAENQGGFAGQVILRSQTYQGVAILLAEVERPTVAMIFVDPPMIH